MRVSACLLVCVSDLEGWARGAGRTQQQLVRCGITTLLPPLVPQTCQSPLFRPLVLPCKAVHIAGDAAADTKGGDAAAVAAATCVCGDPAARIAFLVRLEAGLVKGTATAGESDECADGMCPEQATADSRFLFLCVRDPSDAAEGWLVSHVGQV